MLILTIRTEKPEAELGLFEGKKRLACFTWPAHREFAETIHQKIKQLLDTQGKTWHDLQGIAVFKGPGSFTGLRIGIAVANALADSLQVPIVGTASAEPNSRDWQKNSCAKLQNGENDKLVLPEYGAEPKTTRPQRRH